MGGNGFCSSVPVNCKGVVWWFLWKSKNFVLWLRLEQGEFGAEKFEYVKQMASVATRGAFGVERPEYVRAGDSDEK